MSVRTVLLPGTNSIELAQDVLTKMYEEHNNLGHGYQLPTIVPMVMEHFSDGEFAPVIEETVRDRRVFILQQTKTPQQIMELCMTIDAVKRCSGEKAVVVLPYMPFSRQEKTMDKRTSIGAKVMAKMLMAAGADSIITFDLHAPAIAGFFDVPVDLINGTAIFCDYIKGLGISNEGLCFASPDAGGVKRARNFKKHFPGSRLVICDKDRPGANEISEMELIGDVEGLHVIFVDDMIDTAGTICRASDLVMERGAASVRAIVTHAVMSGPAYERVQASKLQELIVSDTIPLTLGRVGTNKITVVSIARTLAKAMLRLGSSTSLSELNR